HRIDHRAGDLGPTRAVEISDAMPLVDAFQRREGRADLRGRRDRRTQRTVAGRDHGAGLEVVERVFRRIEHVLRPRLASSAGLSEDGSLESYPQCAGESRPKRGDRSMICVAVTYVIKPGHEDEAVALFVKLTEQTRTEPGCRMYLAHRSTS